VTALDKVKTIVIVMMENRSFDHLLGALSLPAYGGRRDLDGLSGDVDPATRELTNPLYDNYALGHRWRPYIAVRDAPLVTDVPHGRGSVSTQLDFSPVVDGFTMTGFAKAYFDANPGNRGAPPESLMIFPPQLVPMTAFLASQYAVCDRWFSPVPTDTQPNRFMSLAGYTKVADTSDTPPDHDILTDWCAKRGVRWRVYHEGFSFITLFRRKVIIDPDFRPFRELASDFQLESDATFPQVVLVEPAYADDPFAAHPDDNHPPLPMGPGEAFLSRVYRAVTSNPARWAGTVMVVFYDEHGGFFDHVRPLSLETKAPNGEYAPFTTTGPRVPAVVVSPLVKPGSVCHEYLDHTSILRFLGEKFGAGKGYSPQVDARHADGTLKSLAVALNAPDAARATPPDPPDLGAVAAITNAEPRQPTTPLQRAFENARVDAHVKYPDAVGDRHPEMLFDIPHPNTGKPDGGAPKAAGAGGGRDRPRPATSGRPRRPR
jgi:phospholipase C